MYFTYINKLLNTVIFTVLLQNEKNPSTLPADIITYIEITTELMQKCTLKYFQSSQD